MQIPSVFEVCVTLRSSTATARGRQFTPMLRTQPCGQTAAQPCDTVFQHRGDCCALIPGAPPGTVPQIISIRGRGKALSEGGKESHPS